MKRRARPKRAVSPRSALEKLTEIDASLRLLQALQVCLVRSLAAARSLLVTVGQRSAAEPRGGYFLLAFGAVAPPAMKGRRYQAFAMRRKRLSPISSASTIETAQPHLRYCCSEMGVADAGAGRHDFNRAGRLRAFAGSSPTSKQALYRSRRRQWCDQTPPHAQVDHFDIGKRILSFDLIS